MHFVFLDEFGHIGPFIARNHPRFNTSPVFGVAGFLLHERSVRDFATWFYQLKASVFAAEIAASERHPSTWEKKGNEIFTYSKVYRFKRLGFSLINKIKSCGGKVFFHGIEKQPNPARSNPVGLYYTVLQHALIDLERYFSRLSENFQVVIDEHQARMALLEGAMKMMFSSGFAARHLLEPPYQVESHLYQTIQAADWIAAVIGPLWSYRFHPVQYADRQWAEKYFGTRIAAATTHSSVAKYQPKTQRSLPLVGAPKGGATP